MSSEVPSPHPQPYESTSTSLEIPPEICTFSQEISVGPYKRKVTCECVIPFEDPLDVQVIHCFDEVMRRENLPYPFIERKF